MRRLTHSDRHTLVLVESSRAAVAVEVRVVSDASMLGISRRHVMMLADVDREEMHAVKWTLET